MATPQPIGKQPAPREPALPADSFSESVAGEEDPGAGVDTTPVTNIPAAPQPPPRKAA